VRPSIAAFVWSVGLLLPPAVSAQVAIAGSEPGLLTRLPAAFALTDTKLAAGDLLAGTPSNTSPDGGTSATAPRRFTVQEATEPLPTPWTLNVQPTYTANNGGGQHELPAAPAHPNVRPGPAAGHALRMADLQG